MKPPYQILSRLHALAAHKELEREVASLHIVLQTLEQEVSKPESLLNRRENKDADRREQLAVLAGDCKRVTLSLSHILKKYDAVPDAKGSARRLKQRVQFGNTEIKNLNKIRKRIGAIISRITFFINIIILGSQGRVEQLMNSHCSENPEMKELVFKMDLLLAGQQDKTCQESISTYADDDKMFRRELRKQCDQTGSIADSGVLDDRGLDALPTLGKNVISEHQTTIPDQHSPTLDESNFREADDVISNNTQKINYLPGSAQKMHDGDAIANHTSGRRFDDSWHSSFHSHSAHYSEETYPQDFRSPGVEPSMRNHREHIQTNAGNFFSAWGPTHGDSGNPFSVPGLPQTGSGNPFPVPAFPQTDSGNIFSVIGLPQTSSGNTFSFMQPSPFPLYNGVLLGGSTGFTPMPYNSVEGVNAPGSQSTISGAALPQLSESGPSSSNTQTWNPTIPPLPRVEINEDIPWQRGLIKKMKEPILWEELTTILRENGVPEIQNGVLQNGGFPTLALDFCRKARTRHGGRTAGTILLEPVKTKTKKTGIFSNSSTTTTMRTWIPDSEAFKF